MTKHATSAEIPESKPVRSLRAGFTLIEILIVVATIAILSALSFPIYKTYIDKAKKTVSISTLETLRKSIEDYHILHGAYPPLIETATGGDGLGNSVMNAQLLDDFKKNIFSFESYSLTADEYTLTVKAMDSPHSLLQMSPNSIVTQGQ